MVESEDEPYKIVIAGLDQAGKTSILNVLNQNYNLMDNIKPTLGVDRTTVKVLGVPIVNFDLGGQARYREGYLTDPTYFEYTDSLFFVIDALQATRYEEAMYYYKKILRIFDKFGIHPKVVVCIHKVDPNIWSDPETQDMVNEVRDLVAKNSEGYTPSLFVTSIYDRKTIAQAFSKNLQDIVTAIKPFNKVVESLVKLLKLDGAIVFDENFLILGDYYTYEEIERIFLDTVYNSVYYMRSQRNYIKKGGVQFL